MRFGVGEYSPPGFNTARFDAKQEFISALFSVTPTLGEELASRLDSLSVSDRTDARIAEEIERWAATKGLPVDFVVDGIGGFERFNSPFSNGARFVHPRDSYITDLDNGDFEVTISGVMRVSNESPAGSMPPYWGGPVAYSWLTARENEVVQDDGDPRVDSLALSCPSGPFEFQHPGDDLARWTHAEVEAFVRVQFDKAIESWTAGIRRAAAERGWTRNVSKRRVAAVGDDKDHDDERDASIQRHFDWFVQYQVLGKTHNAIANRQAVEVARRGAVHHTRRSARAADVTDSSVREAVRGISELLGIRLRTEARTRK